LIEEKEEKGDIFTGFWVCMKGVIEEKEKK